MKKMNFIKNFKKGFTLIELLVVVAIIGILASVVLASLNSARGKGADAAVKANLSGIRASAELYYDGTGSNSYGVESTTDACVTTSGAVVATVGMFGDATIKAQINGAVNANSSTTEAICVSSDGVTSAGGVANQWAVSSPLKSSGAAWCVDSTGASKAGTATYTAGDFSAKCI